MKPDSAASPVRRRSRGAIRRGRDRIGRRVHLLPHVLTLGNLFAGWFAIEAVIAGELDHAAIAIGVGILLDGLDGMVARLVHSSSPIGVQLDSLADIVTFGLAPAVLAFAWGVEGLEAVPAAVHLQRFGWIAAFLFVAAAALRLARFNVMTSDDEPPPVVPRGAFVGMPTPTAAACVAATVHLFKRPLEPWGAGLVWIAVVIAIAGFMTSRVAFPDFKRVFTRPRHAHLMLLGTALLLAAVYYYSEIVLFGLLVAYLGWVATFNWRWSRRGG